MSHLQAEQRVREAKRARDAIVRDQLHNAVAIDMPYKIKQYSNVIEDMHRKREIDDTYGTIRQGIVDTINNLASNPRPAAEEPKNTPAPLTPIEEQRLVDRVTTDSVKDEHRAETYDRIRDQSEEVTARNNDDHDEFVKEVTTTRPTDVDRDERSDLEDVKEKERMESATESEETTTESEESVTPSTTESPSVGIQRGLNENYEMVDPGKFAYQEVKGAPRYKVGPAVVRGLIVAPSPTGFGYRVTVQMNSEKRPEVNIVVPLPNGVKSSAAEVFNAIDGKLAYVVKGEKGDRGFRVKMDTTRSRGFSHRGKPNVMRGGNLDVIPSEGVLVVDNEEDAKDQLLKYMGSVVSGNDNQSLLNYIDTLAQWLWSKKFIDTDRYNEILLFSTNYRKGILNESNTQQ